MVIILMAVTLRNPELCQRPNQSRFYSLLPVTGVAGQLTVNATRCIVHRKGCGWARVWYCKTQRWRCTYTSRFPHLSTWKLVEEWREISWQMAFTSLPVDEYRMHNDCTDHILITSTHNRPASSRMRRKESKRSKARRENNILTNFFYFSLGVLYTFLQTDFPVIADDKFRR